MKTQKVTIFEVFKRNAGCNNKKNNLFLLEGIRRDNGLKDTFYP
jgi:hypothetical protein